MAWYNKCPKIFIYISSYHSVTKPVSSCIFSLWYEVRRHGPVACHSREQSFEDSPVLQKCTSSSSFNSPQLDISLSLEGRFCATIPGCPLSWYRASFLVFLLLKESLNCGNHLSLVYMFYLLNF